MIEAKDSDELLTTIVVNGTDNTIKPTDVQQTNTNDDTFKESDGIDAIERYRITVVPSDATTLRDADTSKTQRTNNENAFAAFVSQLGERDTLAVQAGRHDKTCIHEYSTTQVPWPLQWPMWFVGYVADSHVQRGTALIHLVLCVIGIAFRESPWLWYIVCGLTADFGLRLIGGDRLAVLSCLAEIVTTFIPGSYRIATAPRQFAAMFYAALYLVAAMMTGYILHADYHRIAMTTILCVLVCFHILEVIGISIPALFFTEVLVGSGLISRRYLHKSESYVAAMKLKQSVMQAKQDYSGAHHTVLVTGTDTDKVLMQYDGTVIAARTSFDPIRNCNVIYSFPLLGFVGITDLFFYANQLVGIDGTVWKVLAILLCVSYCIFVIIQILRVILVPSMVYRELLHPHSRYVYFVILTVPLLTIDFMLTVNVMYCKVIFWICAPFAIFLVLVVIRDWLEQPLQFETFNASWILPSIVLIVPAFELPQIYPDLSELAWLWLGFGLFLWTFLVGLTIVRLMFTPSLPDAQRPTIFLIVSTGCILTAAILYQDPQAAIMLIGPYSMLAEFFHWMSTFFGFICYFLLFSGYFCRSPFNITYWAVSFPASALALIWLFYWQVGNCNLSPNIVQYSSEERCTNNQESHTLQNLVILLYVNAAVTTTVLGVNTVLAIIQKRMFLPMPVWSPVSMIQLQHPAFRTALYKIINTLTVLTKTAPDAEPSKAAPSWRWLFPAEVGVLPFTCNCTLNPQSDIKRRQSEIVSTIELLTMLKLTFETYLYVKTDMLRPAIRFWLPEFSVNENSAETQKIAGRLDHIIKRLRMTLNDTDISCQSITVNGILDEVKYIARLIHQHIDGEEVVLAPLIHYFTDLSAANSILKNIWNSTDTQTWRVVIPWLISNTPDHVQRMGLIDCFNWSLEEARPILGRWLHDQLDPFLYDQLCIDYPMLKQRAVSPYVKFY